MITVGGVPECRRHGWSAGRDMMTMSRAAVLACFVLLAAQKTAGQGERLLFLTIPLLEQACGRLFHKVNAKHRLGLRRLIVCAWVLRGSTCGRGQCTNDADRQLPYLRIRA